MEERKQKDQGAPPAQSKASHTPGPWESCGDDSVRRPHVIRAAASRTIIAHTYWDSDLMDDADEPAANAKLIALAPEMVDALRAAVNVHGCGPGCGKCDAPWCVKARAVLAKAVDRMLGVGT